MDFTITYSTDGGIVQTGVENPTINQLVLPTPLPWCIKSGYKFVKWQDSEGNAVTPGQTLTSDIDLNAIFQEQYQIPQPYLNNKLPFDASTTQNVSFNFALLGIPKEAIIKAQLKIVDITTSTPVNVNLGDGIFNIQYFDSSSNIANSDYVSSAYITIPNGTAIFQNNHKYNASIAFINYNNTIMSEYSQQIFFECYATPNLDLYLDESYTQKLGNSLTLGSSTLTLYPKFEKNDTNSIATLGKMWFTLYYQNNVIGQTGELTSDATSISFSNLTPTTSNYDLHWGFITSDGVEVSNYVSSIIVQYDQATLSNGQLIATNNACGGYITIKSNISDTDLAKISTMVLARKSLDSVPTTPISEIKLMTIPTNKNFTIIDPYNQANVNYEYILYPYDANGNLLEPITTQVFSYFKNAFICDAYTSFMMTNGLSYSTYNTRNATGIYEPYGAIYPTVVTNSSLQYNSGEVKVSSLSRSTTLNNYSSQVSYYDEVRNRTQLNQFLTNKRPKILKDTLGNIWVVFITNDISNAFNSSMFNAISDTTYSWVEISDLSQKGLDRLGMLGRFGLVYTDNTKNNYADITTIGNKNNIHM